MRLPPFVLPMAEWPSQQVARWSELVEQGSAMEASTGKSDAFERMLAVLRDMARTGHFDGLVDLLKRRMTARALSWLWLNDEAMALLTPRLIELLLEAQQPRLTRMTLQQLAQLYFRRFDRLDERERLRELLARSLLEQLEKLPAARFESSRADPLITLKHEGHWLLGLEGPSQLAERVRMADRELGATFAEMGLQGFDDGRYGDICRAHFYLETLRNLPLGEWDAVMDELLKPSVNKAPFEGSRRIGHVALEILIDRAGQEPGEAWQNFILSLAGDPRIASTASNYREWWLPLGETRIQKVRGWLSKEDLRLFLQAVEQFGIETQNSDLQRMFPARKLFLEGLFKLKLIRSTRLLLGGKAQQSVRRILGKEVKTSFARMDGQMNDKAVIYLDCGDFHLVEGSHSFKIWVYLAAPGETLRSYERNSFSHYDLTTTIPGTYQRLYPGLPHDAFTHHPPLTWQNKVFTFLADNGIALDIEQLLSSRDYQLSLRRFGVPVVNASRTLVPTPARLVTTPPAKPTELRSNTDEPALATTPPAKHELRTAFADAALASTGAVVSLHGQASISPSQTAALAGDSERISSLGAFALRVLNYFRDNPGDKVRYAANVLGVEAREINQILYGPLRGMCTQDEQYGWRLTERICAAIDVLEQQERDS